MNYNPDYLFNYTTSPCEIGDYIVTGYEYSDDENSFKVEYDHRIQLVEADTDTGADY